MPAKDGVRESGKLAAEYTFWRNKARMSMKTNSRVVEESKSSGVAKPNQKVKRQDADDSSLFDSQLSTSQLEFAGTKPECL
jgi:hypothetical protein